MVARTFDDWYIEWKQYLLDPESRRLPSLEGLSKKDAYKASGHIAVASGKIAYVMGYMKKALEPKKKGG